MGVVLAVLVVVAVGGVVAVPQQQETAGEKRCHDAFPTLRPCITLSGNDEVDVMTDNNYSRTP